jgi:hypothetical protein
VTGFVAAVVCVFIMAAPAALSAAIAQGYLTSGDVPPGTLVEIQGDKSDTVIAADADHRDSLLGVAVVTNDATLALNATNGRTQVASSGSVSAFVSDINGPIKAGDKITASPLSGVGMKATDAGKIVGEAAADFDTSTAQTVSAKLKSGKSQSVHVGSIPLVIQVIYYVPAASKGIVPVFLQQISNAIAGHEVSTLRILISVGIVLLGIVTVAIILFSAVRNSMISIGRNPLAQSDIYRSLLQVLLASTGILAVTVGISYLILSR